MKDNVALFNFSGNAKQQHEFLFCSDVHFDSVHCDRDMFKRHLKEAQEKDALVFIFGDFFDLMESRNDRRRSMKIREEHVGTNYLQLVLDDAVEFLKPYAKNIAFLSDGNHETSVKTHLSIDPLSYLALMLNKEGGSVIKMPYMGYIRLKFKTNIKGGSSISNIFYHHGLWGGVVSQGTQAVMRMASIAPDADLVVSGHTHNQWQMNFTRYRLTKSNYMYLDEQIHLKLGTYKNDFQSGSGFAVEKIMMPKPLGAYWITAQMKFNHNNIKPRDIIYDIRLAK
jgi:predicted phosphodiesterase